MDVLSRAPAGSAGLDESTGGGLVGGSVTPADACAAGEEVLRGTLRWENERAARVEAEPRARIERLQPELTGKRAQRQAQACTTAEHAAERNKGRARLRELRGVDKP
jgi:circadian clock protein KaiC